jgi:hypothetical protein
MDNPLFYERQRMRASTYNIPRFLHAYDETLDGGLILPRGMLETVTDLRAGRQPPEHHRRAHARHSPGADSYSRPDTAPADGRHRIGHIGNQLYQNVLNDPLRETCAA